MTSKEFWETATLYATIHQVYGAYPLVINVKKRVMEARTKIWDSLYFYSVILGMMGVGAGSGLIVLSFWKGWELGDKIPFWIKLMQVALVIATSASATMRLLLTNSKEMAYALNSLMHMEKCVEQSQNKGGKKKKVKVDWVSRIAFGFLIGSLIAVPASAFFMVYLEIDPTIHIVRYLFPSMLQNRKFRLLIFFARFMYWTEGCNQAYKDFCCTAYLGYICARINDKIRSAAYSSPSNFFRYYPQLIIAHGVAEGPLQGLVFLSLGSAMVFATILSYSSIALWSVIPVLYYPAFPMVDVMTIVAMNMLLTSMGKWGVDGERSIIEMKREVGLWRYSDMKRLMFKKLKAARAHTLHAGAMGFNVFEITGDTVITANVTVLDYTINALLSLPRVE